MKTETIIALCLAAIFMIASGHYSMKSRTNRELYEKEVLRTDSLIGEIGALQGKIKQLGK